MKEERAPWYIVITRVIIMLSITLFMYLFALNIGIIEISLIQVLAEKMNIEELQLGTIILKFIMEHPTGSIITVILGYLAYTYYCMKKFVEYLAGKGKI